MAGAHKYQRLPSFTATTVPTHTLHTRADTSAVLPENKGSLVLLHAAQHKSPHILQWCLRVRRPNPSPQMGHRVASESGRHLVKGTAVAVAGAFAGAADALAAVGAGTDAPLWLSSSATTRLLLCPLLPSQASHTLSSPLLSRSPDAALRS